METDELSRVTSFLKEIGLTVNIQPGVSGFAEKACVHHGGLLLDPGCDASTALHEAGHLAITPHRYRPWMDGDLKFGIRRMLDDAYALGLHPDHPLMRAVVQCSDPEATAWAWAAGVRVGLEPERIIQDHEYDGEGASVRLGLLPSLTATRRVSGYPGIHGLAHAGFCGLYRESPLPMYPTLRTWLQDADV